MVYICVLVFKGNINFSYVYILCFIAYNLLLVTSILLVPFFSPKFMQFNIFFIIYVAVQ